MILKYMGVQPVVSVALGALDVPTIKQQYFVANKSYEYFLGRCVALHVAFLSLKQWVN